MSTVLLKSVQDQIRGIVSFSGQAVKSSALTRCATTAHTINADPWADGVDPWASYALTTASAKKAKKEELVAEDIAAGFWVFRSK